MDHSPRFRAGEVGPERRDRSFSGGAGAERRCSKSSSRAIDFAQISLHALAGGSPFYQVLLHLGRLHDKEVQDLRDQLDDQLRATSKIAAAGFSKQASAGPDYDAVDALTSSCNAVEVVCVSEEPDDAHDTLERPSSGQHSIGVQSHSVLGDSLDAISPEGGAEKPVSWRKKHTWNTKPSSNSSTKPRRPCSPSRDLLLGTSKEMLSDDLALIKGWKQPEVSRIKSVRESKPFRAKVSLCREIVGLQAFDVMCSLMIIGNAALMGISVDWKVKNYSEINVPFEIEVCDRVFTCWFLLELILRVCGNGLTFFFSSKDWSWNLFDFTVVAIDVVSTLTQLAAQATPDSSESVSLVRLLRVLRITRALRIVRIFRFFRELRMMVFSVLRSGTSLAWSAVLFFMDIFLFAVYLTQQVTAFKRDHGEHEEIQTLDRFFGSMERATNTLFYSVSGGISWIEVVEPLSAMHWTNSLIFTFFIFFTIYALTNIITGIFVDTAIQSAQSDRDEVIQTQLHNRSSTLQQMRELFMEADVDESGSITLQELESHLNDKRVRAHMAALGLQLDEARGLFRLLDLDKSGALTIDEFIFGCMRLKGSARSIDLATLMYENKKMFTMMATFFDYAQTEFQKLEPYLRSIDRKPPVVPVGNWEDMKPLILEERQWDRAHRERNHVESL